MSKFFIDAISFLGEAKELHIFRGRMSKAGKHVKEDGTWYYEFDLKCLKSFGDDEEYGQSYNMYHMIVPSDLSGTISVETMKSFNENEVVLIAEMTGTIKRSLKAIYNNNSYFVKEIELSREIGKRPATLRRVESL